MIRAFWIALLSTGVLAGIALEATAQRGGRGGYAGGGYRGGYGAGYGSGYRGGYGGFNNGYGTYGSGYGVIPGGVGLGYGSGIYNNGYYGNYGNRSYNGGSAYYNSTPYYTTPGYTTQGYTYDVVPAAGVVTSSAYMPAPALSPTRAYLSIQVPNDDAQVWINGVATTRMGRERMFESPDLELGPNYSYTVRAKWTLNGKDMEDTRKVSVQPGRQSTVDFRQSTSDSIPKPNTK